MKKPSTDWKEVVPAGEAAMLERQAREIRDAHAAKNAHYGKGRFLHRKPVLAARAQLVVHDNLPEHARFGIFSSAATYPAVVRLSNGAFDVQANTKPDIRGFSIRVNGVSGPSSLSGMTDHQDFLLINHDYFASRTSDEFLEIVTVSAKSKELGLLWFLIRKYGLGAGLKRLKLLIGTLSKPFAGFNAERFSSAVPIAVGPYAAKVRLTPVNPKGRGKDDIATDIAAQLSNAPLDYTLSLQFFTDEATTPIEDPTVLWPEDQSPFIPVATLTMIGDSAEVENLFLDPWGGLADHRPLGEIMRSRKNAYFESQKARKA